MITIATLILATLVLVFFEIILPGGVLGVIAMICLIAATWLAAIEYGAIGGLGVFVFTIIASIVMIFYQFKLMAKTGLCKGFFLKSEVTGRSNEQQAEATVIGKEGKSLTRLNPSGKVAIDGQSYEAYSQDGYIESDQTISVISQDNFKLIIKKI